MENHSDSQDKLIISFCGRLLFFSVLWIAVFFLAAGTFTFWEAWVVLAILVLPMVLGFTS